MIEVRASDLRRMRREISQTSASVQRIRSEEDYPHREAQLYDRKPMSVTFGTSTNRPSSDYMLQKGVQSALYFATDTFALSAWTGTAWKSVTLT